MTKRAELPQSRRHVMIFDQDWDLLVELFGPNSDNRIGAGTAIKKLIQKSCAQLRQRVNDRKDELTITPGELETQA